MLLMVSAHSAQSYRGTNGVRSPFSYYSKANPTDTPFGHGVSVGNFFEKIWFYPLPAQVVQDYTHYRRETVRMKKLSEVAKLVGLLRQRIQEYEKAGIAFKPKVKNSHGDWLYGEAEIERLWQIKFYLTLGLTVPKMKAIFADPNYNKHEAIEAQIIELEEQKKKLESMIEVARAYNEMDILPSDILIRKDNLLENLSFETITPFMSKVFNLFYTFTDQDDLLNEEFTEVLQADWPTEKAAYKWLAAVEEIGVFYATQEDYKASSVQDQVSIMIGVDAEVIPDSPLKCWCRTRCMISCEFEDDIKEAFGEEGLKYLEKAVDFYVQEQVNQWGTIDNFVKTPIGKTVETLQNYGLRHFTTGSDEVQNEVGKIHQMISRVGMFSEKGQIKVLTVFSELLGSQEAKNAIDSGKEKGISWFISRAIQIYCDHHQDAIKKEKSNE